MKIVAIIQARTCSTRFPGKVLAHLPYTEKTTVLEQVIRRLKKSKKIDEIVVATTVKKEDEKIVHIARKEKISYFRGSEINVLKRFYLSAEEVKADIIVRITSDCPCIDADLIDKMIRMYLPGKHDYISNVVKRSYPRGLDVEVFSFEILKKTYLSAKKKYEKEHVTPYIYLTKQNNFKLFHLLAPKRFYYPGLRLTLDTYEDYAFLCEIYNNLYAGNHFFNLKDILNLLRKKPWLKLINSRVNQKNICQE